MKLILKLKMPWWAGFYFWFVRIKIVLGFPVNLADDTAFLARHIRKIVEVIDQ